MPPRDPLKYLTPVEIDRRLDALHSIPPRKRTQRDRRMIWRLNDRKTPRRKGA